MSRHLPSLICNSSYSSISIDHSGNIWVIGNNNNGQLALENIDCVFPFTQVNNLVDIKMVAFGNKHTICLNYIGDLFSFGNNKYNQLGISKKEIPQTNIPQKINIPPCKQVSCGDDFTICVTEKDTIFSFGINNHGQLGLNKNEKRCLPQEISKFNNVNFVECGSSHTVCITNNDEVFTWGYNDDYQLGNSTEKVVIKPKKRNNFPDNIIDVKCGLYHCLFLTSTGKVYSCGGNYDGQLGLYSDKSKKAGTPALITALPEILFIECGSHSSVFIDTDYNLWACGSNYYGQIALGDIQNSTMPLKSELINDIIDISSGASHAFFKTSSNEIYCCGNNAHSQLGLKKTQEHIKTPKRTLQDKEDIWCSMIHKSRAKSARK